MIIERLEPRTLFTAVLPFTFLQTGAALKITGNNNTAATATDQIQLTQSGGVITATDIRSGASIATTGTAITSIVVDLGNGNDYLRLRNNDGTKPVTVVTSLYGGAGNDTIYGGDGVDLIASGDGDDKLVGRGGNDTLDGGNGFDTADYSYETRAINVSLDGAPNDGVISIGEHDNVVCEAVVGGSGNDILVGNAASADWLDGGAGNDTIAGGGGNDTLTGGIGADAILGQAGSDAAFIKDGTIDNTGDVLETAQIDSKNAGAAVNDVAANVPAPVSQAAAFAKLGFEIAAAVTTNPDGSANLSNPANLDNTFGVDSSSEYHGVSVLDPGVVDITVTKVLLQPYSESESSFVNADGVSTDKILVIGTLYGYESPSYDFFVMRLNKDGTLDESFGDGDGLVIADFTDVANNGSPTQDFATNATFGEYGNILVTGYSQIYDSESESTNTDVAIAEFSYDGYLSTAFGAPDPYAEYGERLGKVLYDVPDVAGDHTSNDFGKAIVADYEDYGGSGLQYLITVAADVQTSAGEDRVAMLKFDSQGNGFTFDDPLTPGIQEGFNSTQLVDGQQGSVADMVKDSNGYFWLAVNRENPDAPDTPGLMAFGSDGTFYDQFTAITDPTGTLPLGGTADAMAINGDQLVVVGRTDAFEGFIYTGHIDVGLLLSNTATALPISPSGTPVDYNSVAFDGQGRIVASGIVNPYDNSDFIVTRMDSDLNEDTTFNDGYASVEIDPQDGKGDFPSGILVQEDGAIVVAGTSAFPEAHPTISVIRLLGNDVVSDQTVDPDLDAATAQTLPEFQWIPDPVTDPTGTPRPIPLELFQHAIRESQTQVPLVINGTQEDDYISVTSTYDDAGNGVFRVNVNGAEDDWDRRFISEVDINTYGGKDVVRINDLLYNLPIDPNSFDAQLLYVNITGQKNNLTVFVGSTPDSGFGRSITELDENDPPLGTVVQPPDARLDDDPHTPLQDADGNDIAPDPVMIWEAGDNVGSTVLNYTETYPDFGYDYDASLYINLLDSNAPPLAGDDILSDVTENSGQFDIDPAALLVNDSAGPANESDQTLEITNVFDGEGGTVSLDTSGATPVLHFTPTADYTGPASFTYEITDGNVPADTLSHTALGTVTFNIVSANHAPTDLALDHTSIPENALPNTTVGGFTTTDPDSGDTFSYNLVSGSGDDDNNAFTISGDKLIAKNPFDFEGKKVYSVRVETSDGDKTFEKSFTIDVTNVNETPTDLSLDFSTVAENVAIGTAVGKFSSIDPDAGNSFTYTLVSTGSFPDNGAFTITNVGGVGTLKTNAAINYETKNSYSIRVRTTDAGGLWTEKTLTIGVTNVNETPTNVVLLSTSAPENQPIGTALSTLGGQDPDSPETLAYSLVNTGGSNDNAFFNITNAAGVYTLRNSQNLDFETKPSYNIRVRVTDAGGLFFDKFVTFTVFNQNEAPTANAGGPYGVVQGGTVALTGLASTDPEQASNTLTYSWDLDGDGVFSETGVNAANGTETGSTPTFTTTASTSLGSHTIYLKVFDSGALTSSTTAIVNVTAPVFSGIKFVGTSIGTSGSYHDDPNSTRDRAFDGSSDTFFDSRNEDQNNAWTGIDAGTPRTVNLIKFFPRKGFAYRMYGGKFQASNDKNFATGVVTLYTITGIPTENVMTNVTVSAPGQYRYFRYLGPVNSNGNVAEVEFYGTPGSGTDSTAPTAPKGINFTTRTIKTISLTWTASTDYVGVHHYDIYRNGVYKGTSTTTSFTDTGLSPNVNYTYTVKAIDASNNASAFSVPFSVFTLKDTTKPSKPGIPVKGTTTKTSIALSWAPSTDDFAVAGYYVYRNGTKLNTPTITAPNFTVTGLIANTQYAFYVVAYDAAGNLSPLSDTLTTKTLA